MATVPQVTEATGVEADLIYNWVREGRLLTKMFPNLGYPCKSCGKIIHEGVLCEDCRTKLERDIIRSEKENLAKERGHRTIYHTE